MKTKTKLIEEKAFFKWIDAGKPEGKDVDFWVEAENELSGTIVIDVPPAQDFVNINLVVPSHIPLINPHPHVTMTPIVQMPDWNEQNA